MVYRAKLTSRVENGTGTQEHQHTREKLRGCRKKYGLSHSGAQPEQSLIPHKSWPAPIETGRLDSRFRGNDKNGVAGLAASF
jgi:hypothetical protein